MNLTTKGDRSERRSLSSNVCSSVGWHSSVGTEPGASVVSVWSGHHQPDLACHCSNTISTGNNIRWVEVLVQLNTTLQSAWHVGSFQCFLFRRSSLCSTTKTEEKVSHCRECTKIRQKQKPEKDKVLEIRPLNDCRQEEINNSYSVSGSWYTTKKWSSEQILT